MNKSNNLLSSIVSFRTYARHLPVQGRREIFSETLNRNMQMHLDKFPALSKDILKAYQKVHELKVMPAMRALQFGGEAILKNNVRGFNCAFLPIDDIAAFGETLFLLLSGTGVGFSCQRRHVNKLPSIQAPREEGVYYTHDSINGWAQALDMLMAAYFYGRMRPVFDHSGVRSKGSYLVTTGAKAPGPAPLKYMLEQVETVLKAAEGRRLRPIEVHDIICIVSDCVISGGIRRSALVSLFDATDEEMLDAKAGNWWEKHPYRARANNSALLLRSTLTKEKFKYVFDKCVASGSGEPGWMFTNDLDLGSNACLEIALNPNQFCNLSTISQTNIENKKDFMNRLYAGALLGTLQAAYTDFPYLRPRWKETTELEGLIGVSFTGIADSGGVVTAEWLQEGAKLVNEVNQKYAKKIGINSSYRNTTIKPEGTSSCVLSSSSGIHARHADYYLRRVRMTKSDALAMYLQQVVPDLMEDDVTSATGTILTVPQKSPDHAITRGKESAKSLFERNMFYQKYWIAEGHISGANKHNVSVTISYKDEEVEELFNLCWDNRDSYAAISLLPYSDHTYRQAPFEECTEAVYNHYMDLVKDIDLTQVREDQDYTDRGGLVACSGGFCEVI
jgi:ribonucleoside-triphosphate reductase